MKKPFAVLIATAVVLAAIAPSATAHEANPNFLTTLTAVQPQVDGLKFQIVNLGDQVKIVNKTGKQLDVPGYSGEPYLRFLPDGTVQENQNSPAKYLNEDRLGKTDVPANADEKAKPVWKDIGKGGEYSFHDHRVHYMGTGTPPQVKDESVRTKVFDWKVPMTLAGTPVVATGTLTWIPSPADENGGISAAQIAIAVIVVLLAAGLAFFLLRRRMRPATAGAPAPETPDAAPPAETKPEEQPEEEKRDEPVKEAW
jgi:hypothetical protein